MSKLYRARSLLYRRQILQVNIRWKALDEIYKMYILLHRSDLKISAKKKERLVQPAVHHRVRTSLRLRLPGVLHELRDVLRVLLLHVALGQRTSLGAALER